MTDHYELVWRETTEPEWTHARDVGLVDEVTVDLWESYLEPAGSADGEARA